MKLPAVAVVLAGLLVALLVYGVTHTGGSDTIDDALSRGETPAAPDRTLPRLGEDGTGSLKDYRGKIVVLNFWASWCDPCRDEADVLQDMHERLQRSGAGTVLGVTYKDLTKKSLAFKRQYGLTFPSLRDIDGKLAREYGTIGLPETFVIDREGRIVRALRNAVDKDFYRREVAPVL